MKRLLLIASALLLGVDATWADALDDGASAVERRNYPQALKSFGTADAQRGARVQFNEGCNHVPARHI